MPRNQLPFTRTTVTRRSEAERVLSRAHEMVVDPAPPPRRLGCSECSTLVLFLVNKSRIFGRHGEINRAQCMGETRPAWPLEVAEPLETVGGSHSRQAPCRMRGLEAQRQSYWNEAGMLRQVRTTDNPYVHSSWCGALASRALWRLHLPWFAECERQPLKVTTRTASSQVKTR